MIAPLLWITDPWDTLDHAKDTTLRWIKEAQSMGISQYWADVRSLEFGTQGVRLFAHHIASLNASHTELCSHTQSFQAPHFFSKIFYRTDPPVNSTYLHPLQLLALGLKSHKNSDLNLCNSNQPEMINPFEILFQCNEKLEPAFTSGLMPPSLVSSQWESLLEFGLTHQRTVLKPLHDAQSRGVALLDWRTALDQARQQIIQATDQFQTPVLLQTYLEGIHQGETRLWFLDGQLLACAKKLPVSNDFRVNIDLGSQLAPCSLTTHEQKQALKIGHHLKIKRIRTAAVDLIEGWVTDFNFTSPGLIVQMEKLLGTNLSQPILEAITKGPMPHDDALIESPQ